MTFKERLMNLIKGGLAGVLLVLASCGEGSTLSSEDLGTGMNTVDRDYKGTVKQAHDASVTALKSENLKVETDKWDDLGAETVAMGATEDSKVTVNIKALDKDTCRVSVRVGSGNKDQADMIQAKISEKVTPSVK
jgi:Fe2+ transport system protein FeoA